MSVRSGILAILTLGPAYGLQLHTELEMRTARAQRINVGQIYSTLNRLTDAGLVHPVARDDEAQLPRYSLSPAGLAEARQWIATCGPGKPDWAEMVEHILLVATLPGVDPGPLIVDYTAAWGALQRGSELGTGSGGDGVARVAGKADQLLSSAALSWLDDLCASIDRGDIQPHPLSSERPRRGRRPHQPS
ncbi:PadR family transcriptional regulator [Subtercola boreus]|uniref:PadR family transcriptional regulator n=1 Tax=Subtercola boreus TaxID=120213 RepID=UPI0015584AD9|nr:PadR family transcriptional regulator [Subtercola boreus]